MYIIRFTKTSLLGTQSENIPTFHIYSTTNYVITAVTLLPVFDICDTQKFSSLPRALVIASQTNTLTGS